MNYLETHCVLKLNKNWQPFYIDTGINALVDLYKGSVKAINITYEDEEASNFEALDWDKWCKLIPDNNFYLVNTVKGAYRIPTVVICQKYNKIPLKRKVLSKKTLFERDNGICQYTGIKLTYRNATIDHVIPKSRGGKHTWENVVLAHPKVNMDKSDKLLEEAGLKLLKKPVEPNALPTSFYIRNERKISDWNYFLINDLNKY